MVQDASVNYGQEADPSRPRTPEDRILAASTVSGEKGQPYTEIPALLHELEKRLGGLEEAANALVTATSPVANFGNDDPQEDFTERETCTELGSLLVRAIYIAQRTQIVLETHTRRIQL